MVPTIMELKEMERNLLIINSSLRKRLAEAKGISLNCCECKEPLTDRELEEAIDEDIKNPACEDCLQDFILQKHIDRADETTSPFFIDDSKQQ